MLRLQVHPINPQRHSLERAVGILRNDGGICVYPTDTVYGIGACVSHPKALDRIGKLLKKDKQRLFSFLFSDFSQMSTYAQVSNAHFKQMKRYLPGPFTFILPATNFVPKKVCPKRKQVGVRIPDNATCLQLVQMLGEPLANASVGIPGQFRGDPEQVFSAVKHEVDLMLDTGLLDNPSGSTIVDLTSGVPEIVREGKGAFDG